MVGGRGEENASADGEAVVGGVVGEEVGEGDAKVGEGGRDGELDWGWGGHGLGGIGMVRNEVSMKVERRRRSGK